MKIKSLQRLAAAAAVAGVLAPHSAIAAPARATDVVLREGGVFIGQVVDRRGHGLPLADVAVYHKGAKVAAAKTNKDGVFAVKGVRAGQHQVVSAGGGGVYRLWVPKTAPPAAVSSGMVVADGSVASGQFIGGISAATAVGATAAVAGGVLLFTEVIDDDDAAPPASP